MSAISGYAACREKQEELGRRIRSSAFKTLISVREAAAEAPEIRFRWIAQGRGIDYLEEVWLREA